MQRETHVGSYLLLWQMFSNIKMKYLVFCAKPVEDKFLASTMRQNSIHLQFFITASVLLQNRLVLIKSSQIQHAYLCGTCIIERITKYPELTHKHIQQLLTLLSNRTEQLIQIFSHLQLKDGLPLGGSRSAFHKDKQSSSHFVRFLHTTHVPRIHQH